MRGGFRWLVLSAADLCNESWGRGAGRKVVNCKGIEEESQVYGAEGGNGIAFIFLNVLSETSFLASALRKPV